jgi:hypothetical protein
LRVIHKAIIQGDLVTHKEEVTTGIESLRSEVESYKCNNFGHMAKDFRMTDPPKEKQ